MVWKKVAHHQTRNEKLRLLRLQENNVRNALLLKKTFSTSDCNCICRGRASALSVFKKLQLLPGHSSDEKTHKLTSIYIIHIEDFFNNKNI